MSNTFRPKLAGRSYVAAHYSHNPCHSNDCKRKIFVGAKYFENSIYVSHKDNLTIGLFVVQATNDPLLAIEWKVDEAVYQTLHMTLE